MEKLYPNNIRKLRDERNVTLDALAEASGLSTAYLSRLEKGERNLSVKNINLIAAGLRVSPRDIIVNDDDEHRSNVVKVMGRIGAGAEILVEGEDWPADGLFEIEAPFPVPEGSIAFEVSGESMWPRYDPGDIIICWDTQSHVDEVIGWEAAVKTTDGRRYLKRILRGSTKNTAMWIDRLIAIRRLTERAQPERPSASRISAASECAACRTHSLDRFDW